MGNMMMRRLAIMQSQPHKITDISVMPRLTYPVPNGLKSLSASGSDTVTLNVIRNNIFDTESAYLAGYYDDNGEYKTSSLGGTGYSESLQPVEASTSYTWIGMIKSVIGAQARAFAVYFRDSNGDWISRVTNSVAKNATFFSYQFTTPAGCAFVQFQALVDGSDAQSYGFEKANVRCCKTSDLETITGLDPANLLTTPITVGRSELSLWCESNSLTAVYWGY